MPRQLQPLLRSFQSIPTIDISPFVEEDQCESKKLEVAKQLDSACRSCGFFYVKGHGVRKELTDDVLGLAADFFEQPQEVKDTIAMSNSPGTFRGYQRMGENVTQGQADQHEAIDFFRENPSDATSDQLLFPFGKNQWPEGGNTADFRRRYQEYVREMRRVGTAVMRGLALGLKLPEKYFDPMYDDSFWVMRCIHYPPRPPSESTDQGCGAHTDYGCLTIICSDGSRGALQAMNTDGEWVSGDPVEGAFIMNLGDMLNIWTDGLYKSTPHRVLATSSTSTIRPTVGRISVPFFFEPNYDTQVTPLAVCCDETGGPKHAPQIYGEHLEKKVFSNFTPGAGGKST
jgi:isopenicillin N synthase-like dioxygenase